MELSMCASHDTVFLSWHGARHLTIPGHDTEHQLKREAASSIIYLVITY